jgi:hypothetical protein
MKKNILLIFLLIFLFSRCKNIENNSDNENDNGNSPIPTQRLSVNDFEYIGAFRLPVEGEETVNSWQWGGFALTYYPEGDKSGANDGFIGSLFGTGHAWEYRISEISIPKPVNSKNKNLSELPRAKTIQDFRDILNLSDYEIPRVGIEYLPKQAGQSSAKLYFCFGQHYQETSDLTHGWCELNLSTPQKKGDWYIDTSHHEYCTNDYLFEIPKSWADKYVDGYRLATGRFRDGGWSGQGPSVFAIAPWKQGNPPSNGTKLSHKVLLKYTSTEDYDQPQHKMKNYHNSDEWQGAVWLSKGDKAAIVFVGTKGYGECWYGNEDGPCLECDNRGWWSTELKGVLLFYDPSDFVKVAEGKSKPYEPQPYAIMEIDKYLYHIKSKQQKDHLGAAAFDRERGYLYIIEPYVDDDKPIIHVFKIK